MTRTTMILRLAFCAVTIGAVGCGGSGKAHQVDLGDLSTPPTGLSFQQINTKIFQPTCTTSACHSDPGETQANKLNLCSAAKTGSSGSLCVATHTLQDPYDALVNQPSVNVMAHGMGLLRVKPCDPSHSFLITKLTLPDTEIDASVGFGGHMPGSDSGSLSATQISQISDWISRGAQLDEPDDTTGSTCVLGADLSASAPTDLSTAD